MVGVLFDMTNKLNIIIETIATGAFLLMVSYAVIKYSLQRLREDGFGQGIYLTVIYFLEFLLVVFIFLALPYLLEKIYSTNELARWIRWGEIFLAGFFYFKSRKHGKARGLSSFLGHYALFLFAWFIDRWVGIIIIALPLLFVYYNTMSHVAHEIMPASNLNDKKERRARFKTFFSYIWGIQQPIWKAPSNSAKEVEKRIEGAPSFIKFDSMIWTYPHQVVGIADGPNFSVAGPGLIFIGKGKQPFDIVDLRDQSHKSTIKAISRDGISFESDVTVAFRVDRESWTKSQHQELRRANPMLRDGMEPDGNLQGTFPFSYARVKSVLSCRSRKVTNNGEETEHWNDYVLSMAEEAAREVLAERNIKDLWRAREDENSNAAEEITSKMKNLISNRLRQNGIQLLNAKAGNFSFKDSGINEKEEDEISEKQLAAWSVEWDRQHDMALANGRAESERFQQEARAYAHSILLTAIADGLKQAREIHPNLPRYIIALRYIGALEEMIEKQPETDEKEKLEANMRNARAQILSNRQRE